MQRCRRAPGVQQAALPLSVARDFIGQADRNGMGRDASLAQLPPIELGLFGRPVRQQAEQWNGLCFVPSNAFAGIELDTQVASRLVF